MIVTIFIIITSLASSWETSHALSASRWRDVERVTEFYRPYDFIFKSVPRVATCVSAYAEDSSTELTDERRPPLIVRSPKNSQKGAMPCARATGDGEEKGTRYGEGVPRNKLRRNSPCVPEYRPCTPPIHLQRAYIFGQLVFPLREIYHVPTPLLSRAAPSVLDMWQGIIGRAEEWPHRTLETTSEMTRGSRLMRN